MGASGFASLGYQIVWTQQSAVWLGHEAVALLAVMAAFFGGLALGAAILGERIVKSAHPARWYAACEFGIALWCGFLVFSLGPFGEALVSLTGAQPSGPWHWAVAFTGTFVVLLPATSLMGATLPAMERVTGQLRQEGNSIAALYACNTLGAVVGVLASAFWLVPMFGLTRTALACACVNLLCAVMALRLPGERAQVRPARRLAGGLRFLITVTGFLGIGYEVLVVRVLSQLAENTVYTYAMLLAVYLCGTSIGAAAHQRWFSAVDADNRVRDRLLWLMACACLITMPGLWWADTILAAGAKAFGGGMPGALAAEALLAGAAFGLPTLAMGALFAHISVQARAAGVSMGRMLAFNTLGAALAPVVFGALLVPAFGLKAALAMVVAGYIALTAPVPWRSPRASKLTAALAMVAMVATVVWAPPLAFVDVPEGGHVVSYEEGPMAAVSVVADADEVLRLRINNRAQEGSSDSLVADGRQALLPVLLHPAPRRALFLGLGTGVTSRVAADEAALQVDVVELLPEVIAAAAHFTAAKEGGGQAPAARVLAADARRYVRASTERYDVIVSDNFHPARSGSGALYTVEHFRAVHARLSSGGVFCQWVPLHQLDLATLRSIVRSFITVYPGGWAMLATNSLETPVVGLVGRRERDRFELREVRERLAGMARARPPAQFGLQDEYAVLGSFFAGPRALARFAGDSPLNSDDHPVVAYRAPRATYAPGSAPRDRLVELLDQTGIDPEELLGSDRDGALNRRLADYWTARKRFVVIGRDVRPQPDVRRMLAQVREPLLGILRTSPDFRPAYDPLLAMASALAGSDVAAARDLLEALVDAQPGRIEAADALARLKSARP